MMMKIFRFAVIAAASLCAAGCVSTSDIEKLQSQITDLQDQVAQLKRTASSKEEVQNVNTKIADQTQQLLKSNATLVAKVDQIEEKMNNSTGTVEQTNYRIDRLAQQLTQAQNDVESLKAAMARAAAQPAPAPAVGTAPVAGTAPMTEVNVTPSGDDPVQLYQSAYRDFNRGNFDLAIAGFKEFIAKNPRSDLADNAAYWIGESLFSQKKYREAIEQFDSVVAKFPDSDKVPGALLKKGYAYMALSDGARAIVQFQYVVHEYPKSPEAPLARQKLKALGVEIK